MFVMIENNKGMFLNVIKVECICESFNVKVYKGKRFQKRRDVDGARSFSNQSIKKRIN